MNKTKPMNVYNPFTSKQEFLVCTFEVHLDKKGLIDGCDLIKIISEEGDNILGWLNAEKYECLEEDFMGAL